VAASERRLTALVATIVLLLGACAASEAPDDGTGGLPAWVLSQPDEPRYAYGVGSAPLRHDIAAARRTASDRARAELLKGMRVEVRGESRSWMERIREGDHSEVTRGFAEVVTARVPELDFDGIEIVDTATGPDGETLYVLARLDRAQTELRLANELSRVRSDLDRQAPRGGGRRGPPRAPPPPPERVPPPDPRPERQTVSGEARPHPPFPLEDGRGGDRRPIDAVKVGPGRPTCNRAVHRLVPSLWATPAQTWENGRRPGDGDCGRATTSGRILGGRRPRLRNV
jgi:hypothetical protein